VPGANTRKTADPAAAATRRMVSCFILCVGRFYFAAPDSGTSAGVGATYTSPSQSIVYKTKRLFRRTCYQLARMVLVIVERDKWSPSISR
jgi:hypothetical protein